jgi:hypothetical protein
MTPKILLVSTVKWPSLARYAGGFVAAGCAVEALAPSGAPAHLSRYVTHVHRYDALAPSASLCRAISNSAADLIVACDDRSVQQLVHLHQSETRLSPNSPIAALIAKSLGDVGRYPGLLSRYVCLTTLQAAGVRIPETYPVNSEAGVEDTLRLLGLPAVLKADGSWGGDGVAIVRTAEEAVKNFRRLSNPPSRLRSIVRAARRRDPHYLAMALAPRGADICMQRYIEGSPAASAFAAWGGEVVGSFNYDVLVADRVIGPPNVIKRIDCPQMELASQFAAREFGLSGLHGIDFIRDRDGNVYVLEVNPRATHGGTLAFGRGRDLPAALASALTGIPTAMRPAIENDIVALFPREWRRDPSSEYLRIGFHDVPWDDPRVVQAVLKS